MSRFINLVAIFSLDLESQYTLPRLLPIHFPTRSTGALSAYPHHRGQLRGLPPDAALQDQGGEGQEEADGGEGEGGGGQGGLLQAAPAPAQA